MIKTRISCFRIDCVYFRYVLVMDEIILRLLLLLTNKLAERHEEVSQHNMRSRSITLGRRRSYATRRKEFVEYFRWALFVAVLVRIASTSTPIDVLRVQRGKVDPKSPSPLTDILRTTDTIRVLSNLRRGSMHGNGASRIELSWAHVVPCSVLPPQALRNSDPPFPHAQGNVLQFHPAVSIGSSNRRMGRPPKLSRSIEPA
jgi:hypothetical protein